MNVRLLVATGVAVVSTLVCSAGSSSATGSWGAAGSSLDGIDGTAQLSAVAAVSRSDVWAVGSIAPARGVPVTLVEHWNGATWKRVPSPNPADAVGSYLEAVTIIGPRNIWAAGGYGRRSGFTGGLVEHWDGSKWSIVNPPSPPKANVRLKGITAAIAGNVWVVGGTVKSTYVAHWLGSSWTRVAAPNPSGSLNELEGVSAAGVHDIWAAGFYDDRDGVSLPLAEHWDGSAWTQVATPNPAPHGSAAEDVVANSPGSPWLVGVSANYGAGGGEIEVGKTLAEHWVDGQWEVVETPNPVKDGSAFEGVGASASNDAWAVGFSRRNTLTEHWDGTSWSIVPSRSRDSLDGNSLSGVAVLSATNAWAVGATFGPVTTTLIEHWNGSRWSIVASP